MGKNSDYKKLTVGDCIWCDYITKKKKNAKESVVGTIRLM